MGGRVGGWPGGWLEKVELRLSQPVGLSWAELGNMENNWITWKIIEQHQQQLDNMEKIEQHQQQLHNMEKVV